MKDFELDHARWVTSVLIDGGGHVCEVRGDDGWPPQSARDAVTDIELAVHSYWVRWHDGPSEVIVGTDEHGVHLATSHRDIRGNALLALPRPSSPHALGADAR